MKINKVFCLFEQSGHFKNAFKELGIPAEDYDILNDFGETDHVVDLFGEIDKAYEGKPSLFDEITKDDLVMAFFPCTRFEDQIILGFRGDMAQQKKQTDTQKLEYSKRLHEELSRMYDLICKLFLVSLRGGWKLITENPWTVQHYLVRYFPVKAQLIDKDRRQDGDYYRKPTQYYFINCNPEMNFIFEPLDYVEEKFVKHLRKTDGTDRKVLRSMIHPQYCRRFIKKYILDKGET